LWTAASLKFLVPFALLTALGGLASSLFSSPPPAPSVLENLHMAAQPFSQEAFIAAPPAALVGWRMVLVVVWSAGFLAIVAVWLARWWKLRATLRGAHDSDIAAPMPVRLSPTLLEPGLVGVIRPVLLLPEGIAEKLIPAELQSVLAHEACHLRRRDNLLAAAHAGGGAVLVLAAGVVAGHAPDRRARARLRRGGAGGGQ
jgi:beta-lactamase regulating signal transducer with metallopeptidase domain